MSFNHCVYQVQNTDENNYDLCVNPKRCCGEEKCYCYYGSQERAEKECSYHYSDGKIMEDLNRFTEFIGRWLGNIQHTIDIRRMSK